MKRTIIKVASVGLVFGAFALPARADWFNYVVRTSGLGWSDGYHAYDQCPPCERGHARHSFAQPGYGAASAAPRAPYYFERPDLPPEPLPSAPANGPALRGPDGPMTSTLPDPQARYKPRSRYFEALQRETQPEQLQARRPTNAPPF